MTFEQNKPTIHRPPAGSTMKLEPQSADPNHLISERCSAYLLGEMSASEKLAFESELDDPTISQALTRESQLLCLLACGDWNAASAPPCPAPPATFPPRRRIRFLVATLAASLALAAVSALYFKPNLIKRNAAVTQRVGTNDLSSFELQVAKTWVQPAVDWGLDAPETLAETNEDEDLLGVDETRSDENIDWMVAAVEASIRDGGDRNDG